MEADSYAYVAQFASCRIRRPSQKHQSWVKLFPPSRLLEFVAIDIRGPLTKTRQGNRLIVVVMDSYSKLKRSIPYAIVITAIVATVFLENWIVTFEIQNKTQTDNGLQFLYMFFAAGCVSLRTKLIITTEYHSRTTGKWKGSQGHW